MSVRTGFGYDSHRLTSGRRLVLGGVEIEHEKGLAGHSDADVLVHAIIDSILGAMGMGDIGKHFPDTDPQWKDASSIKLLKEIVGITNRDGFEISWVDTTVIAETPKLAPHIESMRMKISESGIPLGHINIKAKTNEGMGPIGRGEGMAAYAVCVLEKTNDGLKE